MKRIYKIALLSLSMLTISAGITNAQMLAHHKDSCQVELLVLKIHDGLYSEPRNINHFFKNDKKNIAIAVGASLSVVNTFDMGGVINNNMNGGFIVPYIPSSMEGRAKGQYNITAAHSQFFIKGAGLLSNGRSVEAYISMNFMGENYAPQLYQAYIKLYNFTVGKVWNTMSDISSAFPTVDYWGPSGMAGFRNASVRYENKITDRISYGASIEMPIVDANYSSLNHAVTQTVPDVTAYIQYGWDENNESRVRLSGVYRDLSYYSDVLNNVQSQVGAGLQLSGRANILPNLIAYYRVIGGYGISSYINDISVSPIDLVQKHAVNGRMENLAMGGAYIGAQYNISEKMFVSALYSQSRVYDRSVVTMLPTDYEYSQYAVANCFYNLSKNLQFAAEVLYGVKTNFDKTQHSSTRLNFLVKYSF